MRRTEIIGNRKYMRKKTKREQKKKERGIVDVVRIVYHFFKDLQKWIEESFNEDNCIEILRLISGDSELDEMPHYDTLNDYLEKLPPECLSVLRGRMIK